MFVGKLRGWSYNAMWSVWQSPRWVEEKESRLQCTYRVFTQLFTFPTPPQDWKQWRLVPTWFSYHLQNTLICFLLSHCLCKRGRVLNYLRYTILPTWWNIVYLLSLLLKYYNQSRNCLTLVVAQSRNLPLVITDRAGRSIHTVNFTINQSGRTSSWLRWPEPIYVLVGYVFESGFLAGMI